MNKANFVNKCDSCKHEFRTCVAVNPVFVDEHFEKMPDIPPDMIIWCDSYESKLPDHKADADRFKEMTCTRCGGHRFVSYCKYCDPSIDEIKDTVRAEVTKELCNTAWLIEMPMKSVGGPALWWTGEYRTGSLNDQWVADSLKAVRFARKQDAEAVIAGTLKLKEAVATEHQWLL